LVVIQSAANIKKVVCCRLFKIKIFIDTGFFRYFYGFNMKRLQTHKYNEKTAKIMYFFFVQSAANYLLIHVCCRFFSKEIILHGVGFEYIYGSGAHLKKYLTLSHKRINDTEITMFFVVVMFIIILK
jgi:hypothetical protein